MLQREQLLMQQEAERKLLQQKQEQQQQSFQHKKSESQKVPLKVDVPPQVLQVRIFCHHKILIFLNEYKPIRYDHNLQIQQDIM